MLAVEGSAWSARKPVLRTFAQSILSGRKQQSEDEY